MHLKQLQMLPNPYHLLFKKVIQGNLFILISDIYLLFILFLLLFLLFSLLLLFPPSMFTNAYLSIFYKYSVKTVNFFFFLHTDRQTDRPTDPQTFVPIEGPTRTLKYKEIFSWLVSLPGGCMPLCC